MAAPYLRAAALGAATAAASYLVWRKYWFFRNPPRMPPALPGVLSPADGTIVYVRRVAPGEDVVVVKRGLRASVRDILREDVDQPKEVIGIFMSPFDVHYNRAPVHGAIEFIRHYPALRENAYMTPMHWRTVLKREPYYANSVHIVQNERTVTCISGRFGGERYTVYVVQIGARTVNGIDSYFTPGDVVERGETFGMIRIGSQVDVIAPVRAGVVPRVRCGDRVRAGESILLA